MAEYEKIWIVDSEQAIITQRFLVQRAVKMRKEGKGVEEIVACLEDLKKRLTVCGMLNTLNLFEKGRKNTCTVGSAWKCTPNQTGH